MSLGCRFCAAFLTALLLAAAAGSAAAIAPAAERQVVGRSLQGRPIVALASGERGAALRVLVVGAVHGDEPAGMRIARRLVEAGPPEGVELAVIPTVNPDGLVAGTRGNARGVDLNRNFPFGWRPLSGGEYSGPRPLSEPESRAVHRFVRRTRPDLTVWFHQPFGLVDRPEGNTFAARRFSDLTGLPLTRLRGPYPGSATRWQNHIFPKSTAFVVELPPEVDRSLIRRSTAAVLQLASELASPSLAAAVTPPHRRVATIGRTPPAGRAPDRRQDPPAGRPRP